MSNIDKFRERMGNSNIYFSGEIELALRKYGFKTETVPIYYKDTPIGLRTNYYRRFKISSPPFLFPFYGIYIDNAFVSKHPERAFSVLKSVTKNQKRQFLFSLFSLPPEIKDIRAFKENGWKETVKYTYRVLKGNAILKSTKTRKIKNIDRDNFNISEAQNADNLYSLIKSVNDSKKRITPYKREYLNLIFENLLTKQRTIYEIKDKDGGCLASAFILRDNNCSYLFANAIHENIKETNLNLFFLKQVIEKELEINDCFDLQGANTPSIVRFKENFNAVLIPYFHIKTGLDLTNLIKVKGEIRKWLIH